MKCCDIKIQNFQNDLLKFLHRGVRQQLCNCRASLNHNILGNDPCIGNFKEQKYEKMLEFSIFPDSQTLCSQTTGCILSIWVSVDTSLLVKITGLQNIALAFSLLAPIGSCWNIAGKKPE